MRCFPVLLLTVLLMNISVSFAQTTLIGYWAKGKPYQRGSLTVTRTYTKHTESTNSNELTETESNGWAEESSHAHNIEVAAEGSLFGVDLSSKYSYTNTQTDTRTHEEVVQNSAYEAFTYSETKTVDIEIPAADGTTYPVTNVFVWRTEAIKREVTHTWRRTANAAISGYNNEHRVDVSVDQCKNACYANPDCKSFDYYKQSHKCDLSYKSAADVGGLKTNYGGNPYDHYALSRVCGTWQHTRNAAISGHNHVHLENVSIDQCKDACCENSRCKSFDYYKQSRKCDLSYSSASDVGGLKTNYGGNPYDHYALTREPVYTYESAESDDLDIIWLQNGCGYDNPPNCLPNHCLETDPQCWTCTSPEYVIDPDFTPPERCTMCESHTNIPGSHDWLTCWWKHGVYTCGGYCCCEEGYTFDDNGVCNECESSTTEYESELASVNKKLKQTNKALIEALQHLEENQE